MAVLLEVSCPMFSSGRLWLWLHVLWLWLNKLWLWLHDYWLRVQVYFNFRLFDNHLWSYDADDRSNDFSFRLLYNNLWSHNGYYRNIYFDFRLLNHHLGRYDVHDWSNDFNLRLREIDWRLRFVDKHLKILAKFVNQWGYEFNHHGSITCSTLKTPEALHPFSCVLF